MIPEYLTPQQNLLFISAFMVIFAGVMVWLSSDSRNK